MKRGALISAGLLTSLIVGLVLFQVPGRRFFFVHLSAADVAGRCGSSSQNFHLLSKFQAALPRSTDAAVIPAQPVLFSAIQIPVVALEVSWFDAPSTSFEWKMPVSPLFQGRAPPAIG